MNFTQDDRIDCLSLAEFAINQVNETTVVSLLFANHRYNPRPDIELVKFEPPTLSS